MFFQPCIYNILTNFLFKPKFHIKATEKMMKIYFSLNSKEIAKIFQNFAKLLKLKKKKPKKKKTNLDPY